MAPTRRGICKLLLPAPLLRAGSLPAAALLEAIAARYAAAATYDLRGVTWQESPQVTAVGGGRKRFRLTYWDRTRFRWESDWGVLVADGETFWHYLPELKEYRREPVGTPDSQIAAAFARLQEQFFGRFRQLGKVGAEAKLLGEKDLPGEGGSIRTELLSLQSPGVAPEWVEQLWVEPRSRTVVQSAFSNRFPAGGREWKYSRFTMLPEPAADAAAFSFPPPKKARRVERFEYPRLPDL